MAVLFICDSCEKEYEVTMRNDRVFYKNGSKMIDLNDENDDCSDCAKVIEREMVKARKEAQKKIRETKTV